MTWTWHIYYSQQKCHRIQWYCWLLKATFSFHKITTKTLKCLPLVILHDFYNDLLYIHVLDMNNLVKVFYHYWMLLKLSIKLKSTWVTKWGTPFSNWGGYNRVFLEIWAQIPIWAPMLKQWVVGSFFSRKYSRRAQRDPQKSIFFIKTSKWEKWWSWWLRMTNAFILCNLLWKVQKALQRTEMEALIYVMNSLLLNSVQSVHYVLGIRRAVLHLR